MRTGAASLFVEEEGWKTVRSSKEGDEKGRRPGVQITDRDLQVLAWIGDQYAVRSDVVRWLLGSGGPLSDSRTRAVIARWQRAGLVESRRFFAHAPHVVWPTRTGLRLVRPGWRWRPPTLNLLSHHHAVSMVRLGLERRTTEVRWVSERELYKRRQAPDAHVADGMFTNSRGAETAVEVELTVKAADRLRDIVRDLTLDNESVLYVVGDERVGAAVDAAVRSVGEEGRVRIVGLDRFTLSGVS